MDCYITFEVKVNNDRHLVEKVSALLCGFRYVVSIQITVYMRTTVIYTHEGELKKHHQQLTATAGGGEKRIQANQLNKMVFPYHEQYQQEEDECGP